MSRKKSGLMAQWRRGDYFLPVVRKVAELFIKTYGRILAPGLSAFDPHLPEELTARSSLSTAFWRLPFAQWSYSKFGYAPRTALSEFW
jgi:hypothetical protein